jgi:uncharacterized membrane protein YgcG
MYIAFDLSIELGFKEVRVSAGEIDFQLLREPVRQLFRERTRLIKIAVLSTGMLLVSHPAVSCQGEDYQRTVQILNYSQQVGYEAGMTGNMNLLIQRLQEISEHIQQLPPSCQALIPQAGSGGYPGGGGYSPGGGVGGVYDHGGGAYSSGGVYCGPSGCIGP